VINDKQWEDIFMKYHEDDKVDVPPDFYEEPILFDEDKPE
jgi:hypothetical protein